jgi:hypothetical protein
MVKSNRENEIKLAFPSPETAVQRLLDAGAREVHGRAFEDNTIVRPRRAPLRRADGSSACASSAAPRR